MRKKILWILCLALVIGISLFIGIEVKSSFIPIPTLSEFKAANPPVAYTWYEGEILNATYPYFSYDITNLSELEEASDLILEVVPVDDGTPVAYANMRKCKVMKTLKGQDVEKFVYIYEISTFHSTWNYFCELGYISMKKDENYIVFLKQLENVDKVNDVELKNGYLNTNPTFGKYKIGEEAAIVDYKPNEGKDIYFNDIVDLPVFLIEEKDIEIYNGILSEIEDKY